MQENIGFCRSFTDALGGWHARRPVASPPALRRASPPCSRTGADTEGQGESKPLFIGCFSHSDGQGETGKDTRLRSDCGQNLCSETHLPEDIERGPEREGPGIHSCSCFHITKHSHRLQDRDPAKDFCLLLGGGLLPRVSKLISVAKYRHFDFSMRFETDLKA